MAAIVNLNHSMQQSEYGNVYKSSLTALYDKKKIWNRLNKERLRRQKEKALEAERLSGKKCYTLFGKHYYKLLGDNAEYYIFEKNLKDLHSAQSIHKVYRCSFSGMKSKKVLMKIDKLNNRIMISDDILRIYFKAYKIESI